MDNVLLFDAPMELVVRDQLYLSVDVTNCEKLMKLLNELYTKNFIQVQ